MSTGWRRGTWPTRTTLKWHSILRWISHVPFWKGENMKQSFYCNIKLDVCISYICMWSWNLPHLVWMLICGAIPPLPIHHNDVVLN
jgi:hypothetical protein